MDDGSMDGGSNMFELSSSRCFQLCAAGSFTCNIPSLKQKKQTKKKLMSFIHFFISFIFMFSKFGCSFLFYILNLLFFHLHIFQVLESFHENGTI